MTVNYAESYAKELANAYPYVLYSGALWNADNQNKYKPVDAKTIKIPTLSTKGRVNNNYRWIKENKLIWGMYMSEIIIGLIPALMWGISPQLVGKIGGKPIQQQIGTAFGASVFAIIIYLIMRPMLTMSVVIGTIISGLLWSLAQLLQYKAFVIMGNSNGYAVSTSFNIIFNCLFGVIVFNEWDNWSKLLLGFVALIIIIIGAVVISYSDVKYEGNKKRGVIILIIAAICFTAYAVTPKFINATGVQTIFPQAIGMIAGSMLLSMFEPKEIKKIESVTFKNMLVGLCWAIANISLIYSNWSAIVKVESVNSPNL